MNIKKSRENDFTERVTEHGHRLPREVAESSSLEILKSHPYIEDPGQPTLDGPTWAEGRTQMTSRGPLQPQPLCDYVQKFINTLCWRVTAKGPYLHIYHAGKKRMQYTCFCWLHTGCLPSRQREVFNFRIRLSFWHETQCLERNHSHSPWRMRDFGSWRHLQAAKKFKYASKIFSLHSHLSTLAVSLPESSIPVDLGSKNCL